MGLSQKKRVPPNLIHHIIFVEYIFHYINIPIQKQIVDSINHILGILLRDTLLIRYIHTPSFCNLPINRLHLMMTID